MPAQTIPYPADITIRARRPGRHRIAWTVAVCLAPVALLALVVHPDLAADSKPLHQAPPAVAHHTVRHHPAPPPSSRVSVTAGGKTYSCAVAAKAGR
jgi:hypothetical protein